jgi:uncharacterized NAD(P)/FAD-binding protein YdhS
VHEDSFVPRHWFGRYVGEQLAEALARSGSSLDHRRDHAEDLEPVAEGWAVRCRGSAPIHARQAVLALGNLPRRAATFAAPDDPRLRHAWDASALDPPADAPVLIVGTGLSMVDALLALRARGHRGPVHAVSRHAALPQPHSERHGRAQPLLSRSLRVATRELRLGCALDLRSGRPWQWRLDANRHHAQGIWSGLSDGEKARFLRHARSLWDVHRHRIAEVLRARLDDEIAAGTLHLHRGRVRAVEAGAGELRVHIAGARGERVELHAALLLNSLGFELDYRRADAPLVQALLTAGTVRPGPCGLGLDTDLQGRLLDRHGRAWPGFFTLGTSRVGQLWETTAAHEIRLQAAELAGALVNGFAARRID